MHSISISDAVALLRAGKLVAFPTETVYGLGGDALRAEVVAKIFETKQRPTFDPIIVHVSTIEAAQALVTGWNKTAGVLAEKFWPGPLTFVLPKREIVPDIVTAGLSKVAIRMPAHPLAQALLKEFGRPIAAPSANRFGHISPTTATHVYESFGATVAIIDGGSTTVGVESTVLDLSEAIPRILRHGGITREQLAAVLGQVDVATSSTTLPSAPGQLPQHYAPKIPLYLFPIGTVPSPIPGKRCGCLIPTGIATAGFNVTEILSEHNDLREMAVSLFAAMRRLESQPIDCILAVKTSDVGLGAAINDRLTRAAAIVF